MVMNIPVNHIAVVDGTAMVGDRRVKVKMIVNMHLRGGASFEEVMEQYGLSAAEVHAALAYYFDNQAEFDQRYEEDRALLEKIGKPADEHLTELQSRLHKREE
jgi:uncharacterized protein (DUF433 family)